MTTAENRLAKMHEEVDGTAITENGFDFPAEPGRYLVIMRTMGDRTWAINCETLDECATSINEDDTDREEALILDLDTDTEHVPILEVVKIMVYGGPDWTRPAPAAPGISRADLEATAALLATARHYFPKSMQSGDKFQLELVNAAIAKALQATS